MAQTEVKSISQDELSQILAGNVESILTPPEDKKLDTPPTEETKKEDSNNLDINWNTLESLDETPEGTEGEKPPIETKIEGEDKKPGRKPSDLVSLVNDLVEAGDLVEFEDGPAKTIEEAKELIRLNLQEKEKATDEDIWKKKIESYSPQIQAILHYAEQGGGDVTPLLSAIAEVERSTNFDIESEIGQEAIIDEYLRVQGWSEDEIKEEIETAKDLNKLKKKAESFLPKLNQMNEQRLQLIMAEQAEREREAENARKNYLSTIKGTLDKEKLGDVKLSRQEKAMIWDGLTEVKYKSWSGQPTNLFFKKLEELQAGDKADYDHFLEIAYLTLNRNSFKDKLRTEIKTEVTADTVRKLKIQEGKKANASEGFFEDGPKKPTIKRQAFRNPYGG